MRISSSHGHISRNLETGNSQFVCMVLVQETAGGRQAGRCQGGGGDRRGGGSASPNSEANSAPELPSAASCGKNAASQNPSGAVNPEGPPFPEEAFVTAPSASHARAGTLCSHSPPPQRPLCPETPTDGRAHLVH